MISFERIPVNLRVPGVYAEFSTANAIRGLVGIPYKILVLGQKFSAGTATAATPYRVASEAEAATLFGQGSMLHAMFIALKAVNTFTESWAIALADAGGAVAATGSITFTGTATAAGTVNVWIAGTRIQVAAAASATAAAVATAVISAINADTNLPVTAASGGAGVVNLTARNLGEVGNDIDVRVNYYDDEVTPTGLASAVVDMASGTGNPSLATAIAAMGDEWYNVIALPYTDSANLALLETELSDRWGPERPLEGHALAAKRGTQGTLGTFGDARNSPHVTVMGLPSMPSPTYRVAASLAGIVAEHGQRDPARPFTTLEMPGILGPKPLNRFTHAERNLLLYDGISTFTVDTGGVSRIERLITTYQRNAAGLPDESYLAVNSLLTLGYLRYSFRARFAQKFPRHKLASDGTNFGPGQAVITPKIAKAEAIALFMQWEAAGLVEGLAQFKDELVAERNATDPNRLDMLLPPDLVNQLIVVGAQIGFVL
ncbi:MAG: phage tail protein [Alphaproteobacteria bacterium RIFCSPHIGHO2_12_FULL_63_12]|nr:MAG: phage tail protein [Alphaproteobacteria bacterium RIFCSPHIGHO2_12_FULL_63_12]